ncbi:MAG TPA: oxygen-dependent coproporphyrinogen oxidase [Aldersonia sp.]
MDPAAARVGRACVMENGRVFERAGVNVSLVHGPTVPRTIAETFPHTEGRPFTATGISLVLHPLNPYAPSFHANFRFFAVPREAGAGDWWFGGGCDLTPMYGFEEDAAHFHTTLKAWCDRHRAGRYGEWKAACDDYFTIAHRGEMRGVGGVFFDHLTDIGPGGFDRCLALIRDGLDSLLPAYLPILDRRCRMPYGERQRSWQLARRGRYVEFNLVYDRGTRFGLQTRGNIEAILMSMPPLARWGFELVPEPGSPESDVARFLQPRDWAAVSVG